MKGESKSRPTAPEKPLYGHRSGKQSKTHWIAFLKPNAEHHARSEAT